MSNAPTVPDGVEVNTTPDEDDDGESSYISLTLMIGAQHLSASFYSGDPEMSDADVADAIIRVAQGAAASRGAGLWMELQRRLQGSDGG